MKVFQQSPKPEQTNRVFSPPPAAQNVHFPPVFTPIEIFMCFIYSKVSRDTLYEAVREVQAGSISKRRKWEFKIYILVISVVLQ